MTQSATSQTYRKYGAPHRLANVTLTDDGATLSVMAESSACASSTHPLQYEGSMDERGLYADRVDALKAMDERLLGKL